MNVNANEFYPTHLESESKKRHGSNRNFSAGTTQQSPTVQAFVPRHHNNQNQEYYTRSPTLASATRLNHHWIQSTGFPPTAGTGTNILEASAAELVPQTGDAIKSKGSPVAMPMTPKPLSKSAPLFVPKTNLNPTLAPFLREHTAASWPLMDNPGGASLNTSVNNNQKKGLSANSCAFIPSMQRTESVGNRFPTPTKSVVCRFFQMGACRKGLNCSFSHQRSEAIHIAKESSSQAIDHAGSSTIQNNVVDAALNKPTMEYDLEEGIKCCFGPGASVVRLDLGRDKTVSSSVTISGIPLALVSEKDIEVRLSPFGALQKLSVRQSSDNNGNAKYPSTNGYAIASYATPQEALNAAVALNGSYVRSWRGLVANKPATDHPYRGVANRTEILQRLLDGRVGVAVKDDSSKKNCDSMSTVKVQWYAPSSCAWIHYSSRHEAIVVAKRLNQQWISGRKVDAKFQQPSRNQRTSFSVWVGNLPDTSNQDSLRREIEATTRFKISSISLKQPPILEKQCPDIIRKLLERSGPVLQFDYQESQSSGTSTSDIKRRALARFAHNSDAQKAVEYFRATRQVAELGGSTIFAQHVFTFKFRLPGSVLPGIRIELERLLHQIENVGRWTFFENRNSWTISVSADSEQGVEAVKNALSPFVTGSVVRDPSNGNRVLWSREMAERQLIFERMSSGLVARAWIDMRRNEIRLFGRDGDKEKLQLAILEHHAESSVETSALPLLQEEYEFILKEGRISVDKIARASGARKVSVDIISRALLVEGDTRDVEKAKAFVGRLVNGDDLNHQVTDGVCPVCFCPPDDGDEGSVTLVCGHILQRVLLCLACQWQSIFGLSDCVPPRGLFRTCVVA